jgi:hypothetical protein
MLYRVLNADEPKDEIRQVIYELLDVFEQLPTESGQEFRARCTDFAAKWLGTGYVYEQQDIQPFGLTKQISILAYGAYGSTDQDDP